MEWSSEEYIGEGGDLIEVYSGGDGSSQTRLRGSTVATRVNVYSDSGITVIISQLHIVASEQFPTSSVTCRINTRGPRETINFNTTGMKSHNILTYTLLSNSLFQFINYKLFITYYVLYSCNRRSTSIYSPTPPL